MGSVFLARDGVLQREVAVKSIHPTPGKAGQDFGARFLNEARCVASLKHPNIVPIFDLGMEGDAPYIVMEVVDGPALHEAIDGGKLAPREVRTIGIQIANALAEAHRAGIVHRDVKPANILQAGDDNWKLVDFGVAHIPDSSLTTAGDFLGTPAYAAPESLDGSVFGPASDVYGLAATLYHVLADAPPHGVGNAVKIALRATTQDAPRLDTVNPDVPADLVQIIAQCLSRDPELRPAAAELAERLASTRPDTIDLEGEVAPPPTPENPGPGSASSVHSDVGRGLRPLALLGLFAVAAILFFVLLSGGEDGALSAAKESSPASGLDAVGEVIASDPEERASSSIDAAMPSLPSAIGQPEAGLPKLDEVHRLIKSKATERAIRRLDRLRKEHPKSAYLAFLHGSVNLERRYWQDGFAAYRKAITLDPRYREHPGVIRDGIRALSSKSQPWRGRNFLQESIGAPARTALESSLEETSNPKTRTRIRALLKSL